MRQGAYIAYRIDGGELQKVRGAQAPVTVGEEGEHTITYYAVDFAGNRSDSETVQFKIDRTSPTANAVSDSVDPQQLAARVRNGHARRATTGRALPAWTQLPRTSRSRSGAHLVYRLNDANVQKARGGAASFRVDGDGDHAVSYYAVDSAGNESEHKELRFRIDKTAPHAVLLEEQGSDRRRLEVSASDTPSGVGEVQIGIRRVGGVPESAALRKLARTNPRRYRQIKLRRTRRIGNRLADCRRKRGGAKRKCLAKRRESAQAPPHRSAW